jgi:predicted transcriptional regulator
MQKDEFMRLLKEADLNKKEFAQIADVPYPTVNNWGINRQGRVLEIPNWVRQFLYHYMKSKKFDYIKEKVCESI